MKGGDENGGTNTQVNENKENTHSDTALFFVLRGGKSRKEHLTIS